MGRCIAALALLAGLLGVRGPVRAAGDFDRDLGAGQPGISVFVLGVTVQGFKEPPEDAVPYEVVDAQFETPLGSGCGGPKEVAVKLELEPCPENVWFILDSPELEEPIVYEMLGIRRVLRFVAPAEVRTLTLTFVDMSGQTSIPVTVRR